MHIQRKLLSPRGVLLGIAGIVLLIGMVFLARALRQTVFAEEFLEAFPGTASRREDAPIGIPAWLAWQHYLNFFFIVLVIRTGYTYRRAKQGRPVAMWWPRTTPDGQRPKRMSVDLWFHLVVDAFWMVNGLVFVVLLVITGQWMRIVPTSWDVIPNAASVALQYLSLDWPTHDSWVSYNALQLLMYFVTVFIAAPLAAFTGYRLSLFWPQQNEKLARAFPFNGFAKLHFAVMVYFVLFIIAHVSLVFASGAQQNLNHMFAATDETGWAGVINFILGLAAVVLTWVIVRPTTVKRLAALFGNVR